MCSWYVCSIGCKHEQMFPISSMQFPALTVPQGEAVYDFCWYPQMISWQPETCWWEMHTLLLLMVCVCSLSLYLSLCIQLYSQFCDQLQGQSCAPMGCLLQLQSCLVCTSQSSGKIELLTRCKVATYNTVYADSNITFSVLVNWFLQLSQNFHSHVVKGKVIFLPMYCNEPTRYMNFRP